MDILNQNRELEANNRRLEDLNREKDGLINVVAHDLKAPLNKTLGLIELVGLTGNLNADQVQFVEMVKQVNENAARLVRDLLDLNAAELGEDPAVKSKFDLKNMMQETIRTHIGSAAQKNITITENMLEDEIILESRKDYLIRILDNLISNAIKFSNPGTEVTVGLAQNLNFLEIWVQDQGPGISAQDQKKLFGKFQKLTARPTGGESSSGLGLAIVKTLADKLDGEIRYKTKLGQGSRFSLILKI